MLPYTPLHGMTVGLLDKGVEYSMPKTLSKTIAILVVNDLGRLILKLDLGFSMAGVIKRPAVGP